MKTLSTGSQLMRSFSEGGTHKFSDPFLLPSSDVMPETLNTAMDLCLFLYYLNPQFRQASKRVGAHFLTDIEFDGDAGDTKERDEHYDFMHDQLDFFGVGGTAIEEQSCYGNSFKRMHFPFDRVLVDKRDGGYREYSLDMFGDDIKYHWNEMTYEVTDPLTLVKSVKERRKIRLPFRDRKSMDMSRIAIRTLDPRRVDLQHAWTSGRTKVVWRFEEWFIQQIKDGVLWQVNETPIAMLKAIKNNMDFLFNEDEVFHFRAPTIIGISNNGWGLPETIANFRSIYQLQVYRRIDESVGMDYMLPFRLFSPASAPSIQDASMHAALGQFPGHVGELIRRRRLDPFAMHAVPFPITYQEFGGEGKELTPKDLIEFQSNDMLDGFGYPAELFRGSLAVQEVPTAIRLFENNFHYIHRGLSQMLRWASRKVLEYLNREQILVNLQLPSMANDMEERMVYLQLAAGGEVSRAKAYRPFGIDDPVAEAKARMQEDIEIQKERTRIQADFEREQTMGSADEIINAQMAQQQQGAGAQPGGGPPPTTPLDIQSQAQQTAQQLLAIPDNGTRAKELNKLKASNPTMHAAVSQAMKEIRAQGASEGRKGVTQQAQQAQQQGAQMGR